MSHIDNLNNYYCYYSKLKKKNFKKYNNKTTYYSVKPNKLDYNIGFLGKKNTCDNLGLTNHSNQYNTDAYKRKNINTKNPTITKCPFNIVKKKNGKIISEKRECSNKQSVYKNNNHSCKCSGENIIKVNNKIKKLQKPNLNLQQTAELNFLENTCDPNIDCDKNCTIKLNKNFQRWNHRKL